MEVPKHDFMGLPILDAQSNLKQEAEVIWNGCSNSISLGCLLARRRLEYRSILTLLTHSGILPVAIVPALQWKVVVIVSSY